MSQPPVKEMRQLQSQGAALPPKKPGGRPRFQIRNRDDAANAIRAVGRARPNTGEEHNMVRRYIMKRLSALGLSSMKPDNWNSDGSLKNPA